uniref:Uncharacterized protein n=1 Tax=Heterorhabditis bacteriophora TaxID=37862 RepID=A0A1I7WAN3_HETBA
MVEKPLLFFKRNVSLALSGNSSYWLLSQIRLRAMTIKQRSYSEQQL